MKTMHARISSGLRIAVLLSAALLVAPIQAKERPEVAAKDKPVKETPEKTKPTKEVATKEKPAKEVVAKEKPAKETPAKEKPLKELDLSLKDTRTHAEKESDRTNREMKAEYDRQQQEKTKEAMRDKTHDGRLKVGDDTSVGGKVKDGTVEVNIIKKIP